MIFCPAGKVFKRERPNQISKFTSDRVRLRWIARCCFLVLPGVLGLFVPPSGVAGPGPRAVTLAWNPSSNLNVAGYRIYYGTASRNYGQVVDAGKASTVIIPNLNAGVTYYLAMTAYNVIGLETVFSTEITFAPSTFAQLQLSISPTFALTVAGLAGHTYEIQASTNCVTWTVVATVTAGTNGSFQYVDPAWKNFPHRYYRTRDTQP